VIESDTDESAYSADDFIVEEDNIVIVSGDGWVKRQKEVKDISSTRLELHIDYDPNELCEAQIERMNGYYLNTSRAMATEPSGRYDTFCPISTDESNEMLLDWNETAKQLPSSPRIAELFANRVRETPKAIAVTCGETTLSYEQLNQRAEVIAQALLGLGQADQRQESELF
jgi:non-ribosomal peptide synthetase component F